MLEIDDALSLVLKHAKQKAGRETPLRAALGLILAEDVVSTIDSPPHDKSLVDGYAVQSADFAEGGPGSGSPRELQVLEQITAGATPTRPVATGQTSQVMTGAPVPDGADAVVMVEQCQLLDGGRVRIGQSSLQPGQHVLPRGASFARGETVLHRGGGVRPIEIGVLGELGRTQVRAVPRPTLAVLSTGNELVPVSETPAAGQIRNSNGPLLAALAERAGAEPVELGIARDDETELQTAIERGLESDILVLSGGVSAGVLDLVPKALAAAGVEQVFHKVNLRPGKPLWFGTPRERPGKLVFGLPGNPVSSLVCFELFVRPAIAKMAGFESGGLDPVAGPLVEDFAHRGPRPTFHPAVLTPAEEHFEIEPLPWQGSADLRTLAEANCLAYFPGGDRKYAAGEWVEAYLL